MTMIRTRRLLLRPALPDDLAEVFAIMSNPAAMTYWSTLPHTSMEQTRDWLSTMIRGSGGEQVTDFLIECEGRVVGSAGYWKAPEIGYILHPDYWGRGFASEAVSAAIEFGFSALELTSVQADVDPRNDASLVLLERLGFVRSGFAERTFQIDGQWVDSVYLSLDKADFRPHLHREAC